MQFQGRYNPGRASRAFLHSLDFDKPGFSTVPQNMVIYGLVILSRIAAAFQRGVEAGSFEEVREHAVRDTLGFSFWFFASPAIQRIVLRAMPKKYRDAIVVNPYNGTKTAKDLSQKTDGWSKFQHKIRREFSFLFKGHISTQEQITQRGEQIFNDLNKGISADKTKKLQKYLNNARHIKNGVFAFGLLNAIALLGVGINLINIAVTRKHVAMRQAKADKVEQKQTMSTQSPQTSKPVSVKRVSPYYPKKALGPYPNSFQVKMPSYNPSYNDGPIYQSPALQANITNRNLKVLGLNPQRHASGHYKTVAMLPVQPNKSFYA